MPGADDRQIEAISELVGATTPSTRQNRRFRAYFLDQIAKSVSPSPERGAGADNAEIVVELARGERLVVRGIEPGVIVEVAAWSGTEAPGDSAVRMLFGAGRTVEETTSIRSLNEEPSPVGSNNPGNPQKDVRTLDSIDYPMASVGDIEFLQQQRRAQMLRRLIWTLSSIAVIAAIIVGLSAANLVRFVHPDSGLTNTLGAADTTIAVVGPTVDLEPESSVLFMDSSNYVLGGVVAVAEGSSLVYTGQGQATVKREDIIGRVLFVIPFIGVLAGLIGQ